jgi:hypothetical protein
MTVRQAPHRPTRAPWLALAGVGTAAAVDVALDPAHHHVPLCPFRAATGWDCPLCGGLRAVNAALRGEFAAAWHANLLLWLSLPLLLWGFGRWVRDGRPPTLGRRAVVLVVLAAVCFTVVRNLPMAGALRPA